MTTHTAKRAAAALGIAVLTGFAVAGPAAAEPPLEMDDPVVDNTTQRVAASDLDSLREAAEDVVDETDYDLWTVYIDSFDGWKPVDWANETAISSDADTDVILLAIAVDDGDFGLSVAEEARISDAEVSDIEAAIQREVNEGNWTDASLTASRAIIEISTGVTPPTAGEDGSNAVPLVIGGIAVLLIVGGIALSRRRKSKASPQHPAQPSGPPSPEQEWAALPLTELQQRAGSALVQLDNDVRASANELAFAQAQFGLEATMAFKATLEQAQQQLGQAFTIQKDLGTRSHPPTEGDGRRALVQILSLCAAADAALDSQTDELSKLRSLQDRVPEFLNELEQRAGELAGRVAPARDTLTQLGATYPATALATVAKAPDQAEALLASARQSVTEGRARVQADDRGNAVVYARTAEGALHQVSTLLEMATNAGQTLAEASNRLTAAIASITADTSDAGRLASDDATIAPTLARAQAAIQSATAAKSGGDPIAALAELSAAEQALDAALAPRRAQDEVQQRAVGQASAQVSAAEQAIRDVNSYIETNRAAVGATARARLTTARESTYRARALVDSDPAAALTAAHAALSDAETAQSLAQSDVGALQSQQRRRESFGVPGIDPGSVILGGILNELIDHDRGSSYGGGSSWGGGWGSSGSSSSWGGSRSRSSSSNSSRSSGSFGRSMGSIGGGSSRRSSSSSSRRRSSGGGRRR